GLRAELVTHDDGSVNVYARVSGRADLAGRSDRPALLISAHTDTVFPLSCDLALRRDEVNRRLFGPGIGDNSLAVAALIAIAHALAAVQPRLECDVWLVANAAEEGLGDLRGIRAALGYLESAHPAGVGAAVVLEGLALGTVYHRGIGVRRYRLEVECPGGHSWGDEGIPSAIHEAVALLARMAALELPAAPRTTLNVGRIGGGTSINTIAAKAHAEIDLRGETSDAVEAIETRVLSIARQTERANVAVRMHPIGNRPAGGIAGDHPLVAAAEQSLAAVGIRANPRAGSTDANAIFAAGIPCVCVGVSTGAGAHRADEYIDLDPIAGGMRQLGLLIPAAARIAAGETGGGAA
ncbi:MAG: M20/M25/M40 family metallo-hydrolase, partial [Spirochaetota bacterium]